MMEKHIETLLPAYLDKALSPKEHAEVEKHLESCAACRKELEEMKVVFQAFETEDIVEVPTQVRTNFYTMLEQEKQKEVKVVSLKARKSPAKNQWIWSSLKIAASVALLIGSFLMGRYQEGQRSDTLLAAAADENRSIKQTAMLSLMENKSASKRIQGVNYIEEFATPDEAIVEALVNRVLFDENTNVRLTAVTALQQFTASEQVKNAFIEALETEKDPGIQILIIQALVKIQEKKAVGPLQQLMDKEETQPFVKEEIKLALPNII